MLTFLLLPPHTKIKYLSTEENSDMQSIIAFRRTSKIPAGHKSALFKICGHPLQQLLKEILADKAILIYTFSICVYLLHWDPLSQILRLFIFNHNRLFSFKLLQNQSNSVSTFLKICFLWPLHKDLLKWGMRGILRIHECSGRSTYFVKKQALQAGLAYLKTTTATLHSDGCLKK